MPDNIFDINKCPVPALPVLPSTLFISDCSIPSAPPAILECPNVEVDVPLEPPNNFATNPPAGSSDGGGGGAGGAGGAPGAGGVSCCCWWVWCPCEDALLGISEYPHPHGNPDSCPMSPSSCPGECDGEWNLMPNCGMGLTCDDQLPPPVIGRFYGEVVITCFCPTSSLSSLDSMQALGGLTAVAAAMFNATTLIADIPPTPEQYTVEPYAYTGEPVLDVTAVDGGLCIRWSLRDVSSIGEFSWIMLNAVSSWDPRGQGAIGRVDLLVDVARDADSDDTDHWFWIQQNGYHYRTEQLGKIKSHIPTLSYRQDLAATAFTDADGNHPDFSEDGAPIYFGWGSGAHSISQNHTPQTHTVYEFSVNVQAAT
jgi:hypothetical protein